MSFCFKCLVCVVVMQHKSGALATDNLTSVELSIDANSKSAANLSLSRPRPVSVPVHSTAADPAFRKLVSHCTTFSVLYLYWIIYGCTNCRNATAVNGRLRQYVVNMGFTSAF